MHTRPDGLLSERVCRLLVALSQIRWMPLLAVCHSDPPENACCMQTNEDQQLCFADLVIWSAMKQRCKGRKEQYLLQKAPCAPKNHPKQLFYTTSTGIFRLSLHQAIQESLPIISTVNTGRLSIAISFPTTMSTSGAARDRPLHNTFLPNLLKDTLFHSTKPGSQYIKPLYAKYSLLGLSKNHFAKLGWQYVFTADVEKLETTFPNEKSVLQSVLCFLGLIWLARGKEKKILSYCWHEISQLFLIVEPFHFLVSVLGQIYGSREENINIWPQSIHLWCYKMAHIMPPDILIKPEWRFLQLSRAETLARRPQPRRASPSAPLGPLVTFRITVSDSLWGC